MANEKFRAGDFILRQGEDGDRAYLIVSGTVEVLIGEGGNEKAVATLGPGSVFGEMSLLAPGPRSATVRATADTECTVTSYDEFMTSIRDNPEQAIEFMKTLVQRLRKMNELMAAHGAERGLSGILWDMITAADLDDQTISDEERERRRAIADMRILF